MILSWRFALRKSFSFFLLFFSRLCVVLAVMYRSMYGSRVRVFYLFPHAQVQDGVGSFIFMFCVFTPSSSLLCQISVSMVVFGTICFHLRSRYGEPLPGKFWKSPSNPTSRNLIETRYPHTLGRVWAPSHMFQNYYLLSWHWRVLAVWTTSMHSKREKKQNNDGQCTNSGAELNLGD